MGAVCFVLCVPLEIVCVLEHSSQHSQLPAARSSQLSVEDHQIAVKAV